MNMIARTIVFGLILIVSVGAISAQKRSGFPGGTLWEDTALNPHDFTNDYYEMNGIVGKAIINRRNGSDGLSVFGPSSIPFHTNVRVIATLPSYDQNGGLVFWYLLGELPDYGFTDNALGDRAREMARQRPIYIFPHSKISDYRLFATTRQAALMDNTWMDKGLPEQDFVGLREVFFIRFTEKAFTKEGTEMMMFMAKKNGMAADDTPVLSTMNDLQMMAKHDLIAVDQLAPLDRAYAIVPMIYDPTNGVIAQDAFLWFATKDGSPLPTERMFAWQFDCLQKTGNWCKE